MTVTSVLLPDADKMSSSHRAAESRKSKRPLVIGQNFIRAACWAVENLWHLIKLFVAQFCGAEFFFRTLALITGGRLLSVNIQCGHSLTPQHNQVIARPAQRGPWTKEIKNLMIDFQRPAEKQWSAPYWSAMHETVVTSPCENMKMY